MREMRRAVLKQIERERVQERERERERERHTHTHTQREGQKVHKQQQYIQL